MRRSARSEFEFGPACCPVVLARSRQNRLEYSDDSRVELAFYSLSEAKSGNATRHRIAIRTLGRHSIVGVCDGDDSREQRYLVTMQTIGISLTVEAFVVMTRPVVAAY